MSRYQKKDGKQNKLKENNLGGKRDHAGKKITLGKQLTLIPSES